MIGLTMRKKKRIITTTKNNKKIKSTPIIPPVISAPPPTISPSLPLVNKKVRKVRKHRSKSFNPLKMYFSQATEDAIILYNKEINQDKRNFIYNSQIKYPFEKLVENIFNTFKFSYFETGPLDVQKEAVCHLVTNMHKYEKGKGKAFSYFSIVAKNYLIFLNNANYKRFNKQVEISEDHEENTIQLQTVDHHSVNIESEEYIQSTLKFWDKNILNIFIKQKEIDITNAILELLRNSNRIDVFNKKILYLYIREISACKTSQITKVINIMKYYHKIMEKRYIEHGMVESIYCKDDIL